MTSKTLRIAALIASLAAAGLVGLTVGASGGAAGSAVSSFLAAHAGRGDHHCPHRTMEELGLTAEQRQRFDAVHDLLGTFASEHAGEHAETLEWFLDRVRQGDLPAAEVRELVDRHLEELRALAYAVGDEVAAVVETLDEEQRELVAGHLEEMAAGHGGGHGGGFLRHHFGGHGHGH